MTALAEVPRDVKRQRDLEHLHDRQIAAAFDRRERARKGHGPKFELPPSLRESKQ